MKEVTELEREVLDATADDYESLEQIFKSLCLEFSSDNYDPSDSNAFYWREAKLAPSLAEIADSIPKLVAQGLLEGRLENGTHVKKTDDLSFVWSGWFRITEEGRRLLRAQ